MNNRDKSSDNEEKCAKYSRAVRQRTARKRQKRIIITAILCAVCAAVLCIALWQIFMPKDAAIGCITDSTDFSAAQADRETMAAYDPSAGGKGVGAAASDINGNIIAWIRLDGTDISYPVLESENSSYYINHSINEVILSTGALFLDYHCSRHLTDYNNIIYGNNVSDGSMFSALLKYADSGFFDANTSGTVYTADGEYTVRIIAALYATEGTDEVYTTAISADSDKEAFMAAVRKEALHFRETDILEGEHIITLSTCTPGAGNRQMVIVGKLAKQ